MKIGIMMTVFNGAPFVGYALQSILRQRTRRMDLDIVVVNDGSTDKTPDIIRSFGAPEIRLIETDNRGLAKARNVALQHMADDTDLLTSLDADDLFPPGRLERDMQYFLADRALDMVYGYAQHFREASPDGLSPAPQGRTLMVRGINLGCGLYRYGFVREHGAFDENVGSADDTDWILRMFERGARFKVIDEVCLYYRRHDANMTRDTAAVRRDFALALLKSARRRRATGLDELPPGVFDAGSLLNEPPL